MACNLAMIGHFLIIWIYYLDLPSMLFETLLFTITIPFRSHHGIFFAFSRGFRYAGMV